MRKFEDFYYNGEATDEEAAIRELIEARRLAVDTETISLKDRTCIGIGSGTANSQWYYPTYPSNSKWGSLLGSVLAPANQSRKLYHNFKYDYPVLRATLGPIDDKEIEDSYLIALQMGMSSGLEYIGKGLLGFSDMFSISDLFAETGKGDKATMLDVPEHRVALKCMNDVKATYHAFDYLYPKMNAQELDCYNVDMKLLPIFHKMEAKGLKLDKDQVNSWATEYIVKIMTRAQSMEKAFGFSPGSPLQVGRYLESIGCRLPRNRNTGGITTDEDALIDLDHPIGYQVLDYRGDVKIYGTYIKPWLEEERGYTHFRGDLSTSRLASSGLEGVNCGHVCSNFQNIPPDMRAIFSPDGDEFVWMDFSQIEMRVFSYLSQDSVMNDAYANGRDIHYETQSAVWPGSDRNNQSLRLASKTGNFSMIFDAKLNTVYRSLKAAAYKFNTPLTLTKADVARMMAGWKNTYSGGAAWMGEQQRKQEPYAYSIFGNKMRLPEAHTPFEYEHRNKCRINYPVQGSAAGIIKRAMILVDEQATKEMDMRLQVHDELVFDGGFDRGVLDDLGLDRISAVYTPFEVDRGGKWK